MNTKLTLRPRLLIPLLVVCLSGVFWAAQPPTDAATPITDADSRLKQRQTELIRLEGVVNDAERNHDFRCLQQTFADDLIYVAFNGAQLSKQKLLDGLGGLKISSYTMKNFSVKQLGSNNALMTYDLEVKGSIMGSDLPSKSRATSIWEIQGDRWVLVYHAEIPQKQSLLTKLFF